MEKRDSEKRNVSWRKRITNLGKSGKEDGAAGNTQGVMTKLTNRLSSKPNRYDDDDSDAHIGTPAMEKQKVGARKSFHFGSSMKDTSDGQDRRKSVFGSLMGAGSSGKAMPSPSSPPPLTVTKSGGTEDARRGSKQHDPQRLHSQIPRYAYILLLFIFCPVFFFWQFCLSCCLWEWIFQSQL